MFQDSGFGGDFFMMLFILFGWLHIPVVIPTIDTFFDRREQETHYDAETERSGGNKYFLRQVPFAVIEVFHK